MEAERFLGYNDGMTRRPSDRKTKRRIAAVAAACIGVAVLALAMVWYLVSGFAAGDGGAGSGASYSSEYGSGSTAYPDATGWSAEEQQAVRRQEQADARKAGPRDTKIVQIAAKQIGNIGGRKFWSWYGYPGRVEWCACFVSWCADQCGYISSGEIPKFSAVVDGVLWFAERGRWYGRWYVPLPGDIIFFDWQQDGVCDHVGIVESCDGERIRTIEGNSLNMCRRKSYAVGSPVICGYGVPKL